SDARRAEVTRAAREQHRAVVARIEHHVVRDVTEEGGTALAPLRTRLVGLELPHALARADEKYRTVTHGCLRACGRRLRDQTPGAAATHRSAPKGEARRR